jgi:tetratricopeptide (TPR) repeat protein
VDEAEACLRESLRYDPAFAQAHYHLGVLLEKRQKPLEAIQALDQAGALDPSYPEPHYALARIYRKIGEREKADRSLKTFLKLKNEKEKK